MGKLSEQGMRAKGILRQYRQMKRRMKEMEERLRALRASATRATSSFEATRTSGTGARSRVENDTIRAVDLEAQICLEHDRLTAATHAIQSAINAMESEREKRLLELRYLDGRSWASVMARMEISERTSYALHDSAVEHFAEQYQRPEA